MKYYDPLAKFDALFCILVAVICFLLAGSTQAGAPSAKRAQKQRQEYIPPPPCEELSPEEAAIRKDCAEPELEEL